MATPEDFLIALVGVLIGVIGTVVSMLHRAVNERLKAVEDKQADADKNHTAVVTDIAESKAERSAFKEIVDDLRMTLKELSAAVAELRVTVGK